MLKFYVYQKSEDENFDSFRIGVHVFGWEFGLEVHSNFILTMICFCKRMVALNDSID